MTRARFYIVFAVFVLSALFTAQYKHNQVKNYTIAVLAWYGDTMRLNVVAYRQMLYDAREEIEYLKYHDLSCPLERPMYVDPDKEIGI